MILLASLLFYSYSVLIQQTDINDTRMRFHQIDSKEKLDAFILSLKDTDAIDAIPFRAGAIMKKAKYATWPNKKYKYFRDGKKQLEEYLRKYPNCIDGHYVRLLVQSQMPAFLGYSDQMESDLAFIQANIADSKLPNEYQKLMKYHIKQIHQKIQP